MDAMESDGYDRSDGCDRSDKIGVIHMLDHSSSPATILHGKSWK